jgi:hypothetical protein
MRQKIGSTCNHDVILEGEKYGRMRRGGFIQSTPPPLPKHAHTIMEAFLWNNKNASRHEQKKHREIQSQILSNIHRSAAPPQLEAQPLLPMINSRLRSIAEIHSSHTCSNQNYDHRCHDHNRESRQQHKQQVHAQLEDIDDDIVCCDGGHCREGSKNLCTVALWAIFVFFIINRIFSHVPVHFHRPQTTTPNDARIVETDDRLDQSEITPFANSSVSNGKRII